ncbi:transcription factor AIG1-like [Phragmites australis]|uniref:transcription factor AIG1-like n=1 Tax=Phragmites australis TaxID=29695 RepID=UPI002D78C8BE|nr:transcription factor AIG1-like [Phragmites australis]
MVVTDGKCSAPASRKGPVRSHSEAERKRRQRINAHLATLRTLVPSASRMDKAALLGEVVRHVRELRGKASDAMQGVGLGVFPGEVDEVGVVEEDDCWPPDHFYCAEPGADNERRRPRRVRAWVCCADRPGLMSDLGRAVRSVSARPVRAEIATVGGRTRSVLELDVSDDATAAAAGNARAVALSTLRAALRTVLLNREEHLEAAEGYNRPRFSTQIAKVQLTS